MTSKLPASKTKATSAEISKSAYQKELRKADRTVAKKVEVYLEDPNEKNVHDLRTATRRLIVAILLLPKKIRGEKGIKDYIDRLEKLMKSNARTRDLDIVSAKVDQRNGSGQYEGLLKQLEKLRESTLKPGLDFAKSSSKHLALPSIDDFSGSLLKKRFEKISEKYASKIKRRLPIVLDSPDEKKELHLLREDTRRLRYILDLSERKPVRDELRMLKSWQDVLGEIHDSDIFIQYFAQEQKSAQVNDLLESETEIRKSNYDKFGTTAKNPPKLTF